VKAVFLDGAGSGAAVTEAFTDLSVGGNLLIDGTTPKLTIGDGGAEDTAIVFDGNAQDFYIGLDDSADDLIIGLGSTVGTTPIISVDENKDVAIPDGSLTITTDDNTTQLTLKSTDADESSGPVLDMIRDSASPADSDVLGRIRFRGDNDAGEETTIVYLQTYLHDASDGTEDGGLDLFARQAGTLNRRITINSSGEICFNEDSADIDFRVESNGNANMLFVDGTNDRVGIGTNSPTRQLSVENTLANSGGVIGLTSSDSSTSGTLGILHFGNSTDSSLVSINGIADGATDAGALIFKTEATGGSIEERMRISSSGTATFQHPIVVQSGATQGYYIENNAGNATTPRITNDANDHTVIRPGKSGGAVQFNNFANDAELMRLADDGLLGIGASSLDAKLTVYGESSGGFNSRFTSGTNYQDFTLFFDTANGNGTANFRPVTLPGSGAANMAFRFRTNTSGSASTNANVVIDGSLGKGSGSFLIDHPLESMTETHHLYHSFIEGPQADLIYRGKVELVNGKAAINIDEVSNMTEGTFCSLNTDTQCFTTNETDWDSVKGSVEGNILTIECQNASSSATISWMVVGERCDKHMLDTDWTDDNGKVIPERIKPENYNDGPTLEEA
jgi:hypothetical protein